MIELILGESVRIVRRRGAFLVCETRHGFICAAAGVDRSNAAAADVAVLLPLDPDASARGLRDALGGLRRRRGADHGLLRPAVPAGHDRRRDRLRGARAACACTRASTDDAGRVLQGTELHVADQIASAAELVLGPFGGVPAAVVRGVAFERSDAGARAGLMPAERDLFRAAGGEGFARARS